MCNRSSWRTNLAWSISGFREGGRFAPNRAGGNISPGVLLPRPPAHCRRRGGPPAFNAAPEGPTDSAAEGSRCHRRTANSADVSQPIGDIEAEAQPAPFDARFIGPTPGTHRAIEWPPRAPFFERSGTHRRSSGPPHQPRSPSPSEDQPTLHPGGASVSELLRRVAVLLPGRSPGEVAICAVTSGSSPLLPGRSRRGGH